MSNDLPIRLYMVMILATVFIIAGCVSSNKEKAKISEIPTTAIPNVSTMPTISTIGTSKENIVKINKQINKDWMYEGPIYETHPNYYPNNSFKDMTKYISQIADLGVKTIYIMPIWEYPDEKIYRPIQIYNIGDYYKINSAYGTNEELKDLINTIHNYDMKIIFDLVTCCTHEDSIVWDDSWVLNISKSELNNLNLRLEYSNINNDDFVYSDCHIKLSNGIETKLCLLGGRIIDDKVLLFHYPHASWRYAIDRNNSDVIKYFTGVATYYIKEYNIDGWRIDTPTNNYNPNIISGDHSSINLLRSIEDNITDIRSDTIIVSEGISPIHYDTTLPIETFPDPVFDEMADASYSYYFHEKLSKNINTSRQLINFFEKEKIFYNRTRLRFVETHDTSRINETFPQLNRVLLVLISTVPGIPMINAGQEIGTKNKIDWFHGDNDLRDFYKKVFSIRNAHSSLKYGRKDSISDIWKSGDNIFAYLRTYKNDTVIVTLNFLAKNATSTLNLSFLNKGSVLYDELNDEEFIIDNPNKFEITVPPYGSRILTIK